MRRARRHAVDAAIAHARGRRGDGEIGVIHGIRDECSECFRPSESWLLLQRIAPRVAYDRCLRHIACAPARDAACDEVGRTGHAMPLRVCESAVGRADECLIWMKAPRVDAIRRGETGEDSGCAADFPILARPVRVGPERWIILKTAVDPVFEAEK